MDQGANDFMLANVVLYVTSKTFFKSIKKTCSEGMKYMIKHPIWAIPQRSSQKWKKESVSLFYRNFF